MQPNRASLERQRDDILDSLHLIAERKAKYVAETEIPLQLLKDEKDLKRQLAEVEQQLAQISPPIALPSSLWLRSAAFFLVALALIGMVLVSNTLGSIDLTSFNPIYMPVNSPTSSPQAEPTIVPTPTLPQQQLVPMVTGLQIEDARVILAEAGFRVVELTYSDLRFPDGYVGEQSPPPNQPAPDGVVTLSIVINALPNDDSDDIPE